MGSSRTAATGLGIAVLSAATFATSGSFADSLLAAGWTPGGAVTVRIGLAALLLTPVALVSLRGRWGALRRDAGAVLAYGLVALAGCQWCFFNAIEHVSVGVALLLEYCGVLLVVLWTWLRHGRRPGARTIVGGVLAVAGLCLVLDVFGHAHVDVVGVLWGLGAALGLAVYYVLSSRVDAADSDALPPVALAWAAMIVGAGVLAVAGLVGAVPFAVSTQDVHILGHAVSVVVPVLGVALIATAVAYTTGIAAARLLGARLASFVGLAEVLFAILWAWLLLRQVPTLVQGVGGLLVLAGIVLVRSDESDAEIAPDPLPSGDLVQTRR